MPHVRPCDHMSVFGHSVAATQDPAMAVDRLTISDAVFLAEVIKALTDGPSVSEMSDSVVHHWHRQLKPEILNEISAGFLVCMLVRLLGFSTEGQQQVGFKETYGGHDEDYIYYGDKFKTRYDDVIAILRVCFPVEEMQETLIQSQDDKYIVSGLIRELNEPCELAHIGPDLNNMLPVGCSCQLHVN
jgi:hypothetical protein